MNLNPLEPYMVIIKWGAAILIPVLIFGVGYKKGHAPVSGLKAQVTTLTTERDSQKNRADANAKAFAISQDGLADASRIFRQMSAAAKGEAAAADRMQAKGQLAAAVAVKENIKLHGEIAALNTKIEQEIQAGGSDCAINGVPLQ